MFQDYSALLVEQLIPCIIIITDIIIIIRELKNLHT